MTRSPAMIFADLDLALMRMMGLLGMIDASATPAVAADALAAALEKSVSQIVDSYAQLITYDETLMGKIADFLMTLQEGQPG